MASGPVELASGGAADAAIENKRFHTELKDGHHFAKFPTDTATGQVRQAGYFDVHEYLDHRDHLMHSGHCPNGNCGTVLGPHDVIGTTFYIACNMMLAFTMFFFVQATVVPKQWKASVSIAGLVTGVAFYNYTYMKSQWVETQTSPTVYRYTDWLITVPLQIVEFYFILKSSGAHVPASLGLELFTMSLVMVGAGWLAEIDLMAKMVGFVIGVSCWLYIVYSTFAGTASQYAKGLTSNASKQAFGTLRLIVSVGWTIYPIGFAIAYLCYFDQPAGDLSQLALGALNITYNLADLINKGAFGLCVWSAAASDKENTLL